MSFEACLITHNCIAQQNVDENCYWRLYLSDLGTFSGKKLSTLLLTCGKDSKTFWLQHDPISCSLTCNLATGDNTPSPQRSTPINGGSSDFTSTLTFSPDGNAPSVESASPFSSPSRPPLSPADIGPPNIVPARPSSNVATATFSSASTPASNAQPSKYDRLRELLESDGQPDFSLPSSAIKTPPSSPTSVHVTFTPEDESHDLAPIIPTSPLSEATIPNLSEDGRWTYKIDDSPVELDGHTPRTTTTTSFSSARGPPQYLTSQPRMVPDKEITLLRKINTGNGHGLPSPTDSVLSPSPPDSPSVITLLTGGLSCTPVECCIAFRLYSKHKCCREQIDLG